MRTKADKAKEVNLCQLYVEVLCGEAPSGSHFGAAIQEGERKLAKILKIFLNHKLLLTFVSAMLKHRTRILSDDDDVL